MYLHHHLYAFLALAEDLNYRRAAAKLCLSQPALSAQIADLERHLGVRLFHRDRSGTRLTADGEMLLPLARTAVAAAADLELAAHRSPRHRRRFSAGVMDHGIGDLTWPLLRTFHDTRPDIELNVRHVAFSDALPLLDSGAIDVLLAVGPFGDEDGVATTVGTMPMACVLPAHHPRAEADAVDLDWLCEQIQITPPPQMGRTFAAFWKLRDLGAAPARIFQVLEPGIGVARMNEIIARGGFVGPWPAGVQTTNLVVVRPVSTHRAVPVQILASHHANPDVAQFCGIAERLARTFQLR